MAFAHRDNRGRRSTARPDINLTELAEEVGVGPDYLSKLFRGIGNPSVPLAVKLAEAMRIPLQTLLDELDTARWKAGKAKEEKRK